MATPTDTHATAVREKPTQSIFIGWLALGLLVFAVAVALVGVGVALTHV